MYYFKAIVIVALSIFTLFASKVNSDNSNGCSMVPFKTKNGLVGHCCVFLKNPNDSVVFPAEEVAEQISTKFGEEAKSKDKEVKVEGKIGAKTGEETVTNEKKEVKLSGAKEGPSAHEHFMFPDEVAKFNKNKNVTKTDEKAKNDTVMTPTRNAFDVPERCPDGLLKDHHGKCTEPF